MEKTDEDQMTRTIAVSDDVYELLKKFKLPGESFSEVIRRGLRSRGRLVDLAGGNTISKKDWRLATLHLTKAEERTAEELARG